MKLSTYPQDAKIQPVPVFLAIGYAGQIPFEYVVNGPKAHELANDSRRYFAL